MSTVLTDIPTQAVPQSAVSIDALTVAFPNGVTALRNLSLDIQPAAHCVILGASGSGKTTLLAAVAGRCEATSGRVRVTGRVATIHQDLRLVKERSAMQNVLDGAASRLGTLRTLLRYPPAEVERAKELLNVVGLSHRVHARVAKLSGGEIQRVAIARALMNDPNILLADEPVASLDAANARQIMRLLTDLCRVRNVTLISVLHDRDLAETFGDRLLWLRSGELLPESQALPDQTDEPFVEDHSPRAVTSDDRPSPVTWIAIGTALLAVYAVALYYLPVSRRDLEYLWPNLQRFGGRLIPTSAQWAAIDWSQVGYAILETLQLALLGTTLAVVVSLPLSALAARNVAPWWVLLPMRGILNTIRAVPSLIWALLFVAIVGLGPLPGLLALAAYSMGYLTKFFYEAFETVDPKVPNALAELGMGGLARFRRSIWPAARASVLSSCIFMLEYNVRTASVLGVVDAGGIGTYLRDHLVYGNYHVVGVLLAVLVVMVLVLDAVSSRLRRKLVQG